MLLALRHSTKPCCGLSLLCAEGGVADGCFSAIMEKGPIDISAAASSSAFREVHNVLSCHELTEPEQLGSGINRPLLICLEWFCLFAVFSSCLGSTCPSVISSLQVESLCKRCVFLFCSYVACYILEFWFRLMISNVIVGYKTKVKSCRFLCSNLSEGIFVLPCGSFAVFACIRIPVAQLN